MSSYFISPMCGKRLCLNPRSNFENLIDFELLKVKDPHTTLKLKTFSGSALRWILKIDFDMKKIIYKKLTINNSQLIWTLNL